MTQVELNQLPVGTKCWKVHLYYNLSTRQLEYGLKEIVIQNDTPLGSGFNVPVYQNGSGRFAPQSLVYRTEPEAWSALAQMVRGLIEQAERIDGLIDEKRRLIEE